MRTKRYGFTLIEVVVSVGIFMLIAIVVVDFFISNDSLIRSEEASLDVVGSASAIVSDVQVMTLQALEIVDSHTFSGTTYASATSTLVLRLPSITSTGAIVSGQYDYIAYYATSSNVFRIIDAGAGSTRASATKRLGNSVSSLTFTYTVATPSLSSSVEIDVVTQKIVKKTTATTHLRQEVLLRNR